MVLLQLSSPEPVSSVQLLLLEHCIVPHCSPVVSLANQTFTLNYVFIQFYFTLPGHMETSNITAFSLFYCTHAFLLLWLYEFIIFHCHRCYLQCVWSSCLNATKKDNKEFQFIPSTYILLWWINTDKKKKITNPFQGGCPVFAFSPSNCSLILNISPGNFPCPMATTLCLIWFLTEHNSDTSSLSSRLGSHMMWNNSGILHVFLLTLCELSFGLHWHLSEISASLIAKCSTVLAG